MNTFKDNITDPDFWLRLLYTLLFALAWQVVELLLAVILVVQILFRLFTGRPHEQLAGLGNSLSQYAWQMGRYVSGATEVKPWPFNDWPAADAEWQPKPPQGPVTVDPQNANAPASQAGPAAMAPSSPIMPTQPAPPVVDEVPPEPPVVEPDAPVLHPTDTDVQPEPPIVQPLRDEPRTGDEGMEPKP